MLELSFTEATLQSARGPIKGQKCPLMTTGMADFA
jgi:hypothetical protein